MGIDTFRLVNSILALLTFPASLYVLVEVSREKKVVPRASLTVNLILRLVFGIISVASIYSSVLSMLLYLHFDFENNLGLYSQYLFNGRNLLVNAGGFIASWGFYLIQKKSS